ncbi:protease complex subunit PrcB family protein [Virgibacillus siamensis]|uniref:protease complex subunit PrcB family protein n=1 Tax=Virgibacillus siamensis TaxID=480071 RepID=UPI000987AFFA|nr:protease complex subunit PrcB family protein [Virgibacillus siamensis]
MILRKSVGYLVIITLIILLSGCGSGLKEDDSMAGQKENGSLSVKISAVPDTVQKWIEKNQSKQQNKVFRADGKTYVVILLGEKNTGGYNVEVEKIKQTGNDEASNVVSYRVTEPAKGSVNIQVLTYPMAIAALDSDVEGPFTFEQIEEN